MRFDISIYAYTRTHMPTRTTKQPLSSVAIEEKSGGALPFSIISEVSWQRVQVLLNLVHLTAAHAAEGHNRCRRCTEWRTSATGVRTALA